MEVVSFWCVFNIFTIVTALNGNLWLLPTKTFFLVQESSPLQLNCIFERQDNASVKLEFRKNNVVIDGNYGSLTEERQMLNQSYRTTLKFEKLATTLADEGVFECHAGQVATEIKVDIFTLKIVNAEYPVNEFNFQPVDTLNLICMVENVRPGVDVNITWSRNGKQLVSGVKYNITNDGHLAILNPNLDDIGEYRCNVTFFADSIIEMQSVGPYLVSLRGGPHIVHLARDQQDVKSKSISITCVVAGYPTPNITWSKNGDDILSPNRSQILTVNGIQEQLTVSSHDGSGKAFYKCLATNDVAPFKASREIAIDVSDNRSSTASTITEKTLLMLYSFAFSAVVKLQ